MTESDPEGILKYSWEHLILMLSRGQVSTKLQCSQCRFVEAVLPTQHILRTGHYANLTLHTPCLYGEKQQGIPIHHVLDWIELSVDLSDIFITYLKYIRV